MTNHTREISDARFLARIEQAGEARAAAMRAMPRDCLIRVASEPRPHLLQRLVWPDVTLCAVGVLG